MTEIPSNVCIQQVISMFQKTSSSKDKDNTNYSPAIRRKADYEYRYYKTNGNGAVQNRR